MIIIPAIDVIDGKCVRLSQGDYQQKKIYNENVLEVALSFQDAGLSHLHLVDLDGAKAGAVTNWAVVKEITSKTNLRIDFGGGIKTQDELTKLFDLGVVQVNLGSIAVKNPKLVFEWIDLFGADRVILSADVKHEQIKVAGWQEQSSMTIQSITELYTAHGIRYITCTDIATDGMLMGPNVDLYRKLVSNYPQVNWIASGGVSAVHDLHNLQATGVAGVIVGKAIYEGKIKLNELAQINAN